MLVSEDSYSQRVKFHFKSGDADRKDTRAAEKKKKFPRQSYVYFHNYSQLLAFSIDRSRREKSKAFRFRESARSCNLPPGEGEGDIEDETLDEIVRVNVKNHKRSFAALKTSTREDQR